MLQRKANPLKLSIFSFIIGQHRRILDWLKTLPWVDGERIGFYGLSYGGKTAMRVPAVLEDYALSICSGDFNQWIWKNVTVEWPNSYMFTGEYEMPEFGLGTSFNYAEMAYLIFPRPFMVERGHRDAVGLDEWVAHEYAKVRRLYRELGQGQPHRDRMVRRRAPDPRGRDLPLSAQTPRLEAAALTVAAGNCSVPGILIGGQFYGYNGSKQSDQSR